MKRLGFLPLLGLTFVTACDEASQPLEPDAQPEAAMEATSEATTHWVKAERAEEFPAPGESCERAGYTAVQEAVDEASAGDKVKVCPGTYTESVRITGGGNAGLTLTSADPDEPAVIVATRDASPFTGVFATSPEAKVTHLVVHGNEHDGIHVGGSDVMAEHNVVVRTERWGIRVAGSGGTVNHNEVGHARDGIYVTGTDATVNHNEVGTGQLGRWGIAVVGGHDNTVHHNEVHGHVRTHANSSGNGVRHSTFETCTNDGDDNDWHRNDPDDCDVERGQPGR